MRMPALSILASAKTLGQEIVAKKKALDQLFSNKTISEQELSRASTKSALYKADCEQRENLRTEAPSN